MLRRKNKGKLKQEEKERLFVENNVKVRKEN